MTAFHLGELVPGIVHAGSFIAYWDTWWNCAIVNVICVLFLLWQVKISAVKKV